MTLALAGGVTGHLEPTADLAPVDKVPEGGDVIGLPPLVLGAVGVLPEVEPQERPFPTSSGESLLGRV